ncbi:MAG: hypothetical protein KGH63_03070 [Candidatus Micrarchaeota archaeon]|nr:hypothetical protein [Candidatus Micrarchaeota archaeon]
MADPDAAKNLQGLTGVPMADPDAAKNLQGLTGVPMADLSTAKKAPPRAPMMPMADPRYVFKILQAQPKPLRYLVRRPPSRLGERVRAWLSCMRIQ